MRYRLVLAIALLPAVSAAQPVGVESSPIVTFDPYGRGNYPPTARTLTSAELRLARERAERIFDVLRAAPAFARPSRHATMLTSWAVISPDGAMEQSFTAYWSNPRDVLRRGDGALWPKLGGAHQLLYFGINRPPGAGHLVDAATRGDFSRGVDNDGLPQGAFAQPRTFGELGGGTVFADMIVLTRDGRSPLAPAAIGPLLEGEIARLKKIVADSERSVENSLQQLESSMTPAAVAERRARREARWKTETRDPAALALRLDAAERTDDYDYLRQKEQLSSPALRQPRMALEALQQRLAALDAAGRQAAACARLDAAFSAPANVRFEPLGSTPDCVPMVEVRRDLVDPRRPASEVQVMSVWFREGLCGIGLAAEAARRSERCELAVPLLRELDWGAMRRSVGW